MDELEENHTENQAQWTCRDLFWIAGSVFTKQKDFFTPNSQFWKAEQKRTLITHAQKYSQITHLCVAEQESSLCLTNHHSAATSYRT